MRTPTFFDAFRSLDLPLGHYAVFGSGPLIVRGIIDASIDTAEMISGLPFVRLEHVIAYKRLAGRPKDLEHVRKHEEFQHDS